MIVYKLLIINNDPKNLRILKNNFVESQFDVVEALNESDAIKSIKTSHYHAILTEIIAPGIDGYRILEETQKTPHNRHCAVIFLTQKTDIWNRTKSFKLGIKDYIIKPVHVKEIVGRVSMVLNRIARHKEDFGLAQKKFIGRLEELNLFELVEIFGFKRKTGILSIYNENNCSGIVYFKDGAVINASTSLQRGEEAIYKMMAWKKGRFSMLFTEPSVHDELGVSNMGILLQGAKRMDQREQLLRQLPTLEAVLVTTTNFKKIVGSKTLAKDLEYFVSLFDGEHTLGRIIDESKYDEITTLQRILKLYELGFLHTLRDFKAPVIKSEKDVPLGVFSESQTSIRDEEETSVVEEEIALNEEVTEDLLTEESHPPDKPFEEEPVSPEQKTALPLEKEPHLYQDFSLEEYSDFINQDFSSYEGDLDYEKDVFHHDKKQQTAKNALPFNAPSDVRPQEEELFSSFDILEHQHPADALLSVGSDPGFLDEQITPSPAGTTENEPLPGSADDEMSHLEKENAIQARFSRAHGSVLILSTNTKIQKEMVHSLTGGEILEKKIFTGQSSDIFLGTADFKGGHLLNILGVAINNEFVSIIDYFSASLLGYILLVDANNISCNYFHYLLQVLHEKSSIPIMIVITQTYNNSSKTTLEAYRNKFILRENDHIKLCEELTPINSKRILFNLIESYHRVVKQTNRNLKPATLK